MRCVKINLPTKKSVIQVFCHQTTNTEISCRCLSLMLFIWRESCGVIGNGDLCLLVGFCSWSVGYFWLVSRVFLSCCAPIWLTLRTTAGFDSSCTCYGSHLHGWEGEEVHLHRARNNSRFSVLVVVFNHIAVIISGVRLARLTSVDTMSFLRELGRGLPGPAGDDTQGGGRA